ncbi:MAG: sulfatase-like hydrolase/transferase [Planctomycetota bacterium]
MTDEPAAPSDSSANVILFWRADYRRKMAFLQSFIAIVGWVYLPVSALLVIFGIFKPIQLAGAPIIFYIWWTYSGWWRDNYRKSYWDAHPIPGLSRDFDAINESMLPSARLLAGASWSRFAAHAWKDIKMIAVWTAILFFFRIILIATYRVRLSPETGIADIAATLGRGLQFDLRISTLVALPTILLSAIGAFRPMNYLINKVRSIIASLFATLSLILCGLTLGYVSEFNAQFNHFVFNAVVDDFDTVMTTLWVEFHPIISIALFIIVVRCILSSARRFIRTEPDAIFKLPSLPAALKAALTVVFIVLLVFSVRGRLLGRPLQRKDAGVTSDLFLNDMTLNCWFTAHYAIYDFRRTRVKDGYKIFIPDGNIRAAADGAFGSKPDAASLDDYTRRVARGNPSPKPEHIFMIIMESNDAWPLQDEFASLHLSDGLKNLGRDGILIRKFVSASSGTITSLSAIISGMNNPGVTTQMQPSATKPYPTSIAPIFKRLGYKTKLFYSGLVSWQGLQSFSLNQGFDEIHGGAKMEDPRDTASWGVEDEFLWNYINRETDADPTPSFNVVLTRSYHPPYDMDIYKLGYPVKTMPADIETIWNRQHRIEIYGHQWYSNRELERFVRGFVAKRPLSIFAVTGDHYSRKCIRKTPSLYEATAVPCLLFGPSIIKPGIVNADDLCGDHLDMIPTLIERAAPVGFEYHAVGRDLLDGNNAEHVGFCASGTIIGRDFIFSVKTPDRVEPLPFPVERGLPERDALDGWAKRYNQRHGFAWWRIMKGNDLPAPK